jgi:hypothetical protein
MKRIFGRFAVFPTIEEVLNPCEGDAVLGADPADVWLAALPRDSVYGLFKMITAGTVIGPFESSLTVVRHFMNSRQSRPAKELIAASNWGGQGERADPSGVPPQRDRPDWDGRA